MRIRRSPLLIAFVMLGAMVHAVPPPKPEQTEWIEKKLESIIIPRLEFREVGIVEAVEFLRKKAVELDPLRAGVPIYLRLQPTAPAQPPPTVGQNPGFQNALLPSPAEARITVSLTNIPLKEALRYVSSLAGLKFRVMIDGVHVVPASDPDPLYDRDFEIAPDVLNELRKPSTKASELAGRAPIEDMKAFLVSNGALFRDGGSAVLNKTGTRLHVRTTVEQLDFIAFLLTKIVPEPIPGPEVPKYDASQFSDEANPLRQHADRIILPEVRLVNATVREAIEALKRLAIAHDPQESPAERGFGILLKLDSPQNPNSDPPPQVAIPGLEPLPPHALLSPPVAPPLPQSPEKRITYLSQRVSVAVAFDEVATRLGLKTNWNSGMLALVPRDTPESIFTVEYLVLPEMIGGGPNSEAEPNAASDKVSKDKDWLISSGVPFGPSASAIYLPSSRKLIVRDTREKQEEVRELVEKAWDEYYKAHLPTPASQAPATPAPVEAAPQ